MAEFTDAEGRKWRLRITMGDLARLKAAGLDVTKSVDDPKALQAITNDFEIYGRVLWELCEAQALAANVTPEAFAAGFDGPTLFAAGGAIEEALWDFSRPPQVAKKFAQVRGTAMDRLLGEAVEKLDRMMTGSPPSAGNSPAPPG